MTFFSDIEREEAIRIVELLVHTNRVDLIVPSLRQGATLDDVRQRLAVEATAAPAASSPAATAPRPATSLVEQLEAASQEKFAQMSRAYPPWGIGETCR